MTNSRIYSTINDRLPTIFIGVNPSAVKALAAAAGRPYAKRVDEIIAALTEQRSSNQTADLREVCFSHAGRTVTAYFAKVRGHASGDVPKLRALAASIDDRVDVENDNYLKEFVRDLKAAVEHRGQDADAVLSELAGQPLKWDAAG